MYLFCHCITIKNVNIIWFKITDDFCGDFITVALFNGTLP